MLPRALLTALLLGLSSTGTAKAPFSLSVDQALTWSANSPLADARNVSTIELAPRFEHRPSQLNPQNNPKVKVLIAPDGMDNFGSYLNEQKQFNLYNFTHWAQVDVLNWFAGTADQNINIPARPWVEAAHKNGVKVIGSIYLAVAQWGGSADTAEAFLVRDDAGRFPMAHKLVDIASYYGFDGWLMNQETDLSAVKDNNNQLLKGVRDYNRAALLGKEMLAFMTYLNHIAPDGMEIHWYDAQLLDGTVRWQNELNEKNAVFFGHQYAQVSDAIFLNYWWDRTMVEQSHAAAKQLRRDPYEVYTGVDLWPARNAQKAFTRTAWLDDIFSDENKQGMTSIALFGNNFNFNFSGTDQQPAYSRFSQDASDYQRYYENEARLFVGDNNDAKAWKGIGHYIPARSVISKLPFKTSFNTGHGLLKMKQGQLLSESPWHDMTQQDILPSWQFRVMGSKQLQVAYDFNVAYSGGSSLSIIGATQQTAADIPLYKTQLDADSASLTVASKGQGEAQLVLTYADGSELTIGVEAASPQWQLHTVTLPEKQQLLQRIGLRFKQGQQGIAFNLGALSIE